MDSPNHEDARITFGPSATAKFGVVAEQPSRSDISYDADSFVDAVNATDIYNKVRSTRKSKKKRWDEAEGMEKAVEGESGPVPLVTVDENGIFKIDPQGAQVMKNVQGKVVIVSIAGPARAGKSFLLNLLLNQSGKQGFQVGSSVKSCTQGIWIWGSPIKRRDTTIIFLDTEGSKSVEKSSTHDAKIFAMVMLISSLFIFNTKGVIDEQAINQLSLATYISDNLSFRSSESDTDEEIRGRIAAMAPKFIWLLRDFHLSLEDKFKNTISAKEYMENVLSIKTNSVRNPETYRKVRETILGVFLERDCFTLVRPMDKEEDLMRLSQFSLDNMREAFVKGFRKLQMEVLERAPAKRLYGQDLSGSHILGLLIQYVRAINQGVVPNINTTWRHVLENEYMDKVEECKERYNQARQLQIQEMPYEEGDLILRLQSAKEEALSILRDMTMRDEALEENCREEFEVFFEEDLKFTLEANKTSSEAYNLNIINKLFKKIIRGLDSGEYKENYEGFRHDWETAMQEYEERAIGPGKFTAISEFSRKHQHSAFAKIFEEVISEYETKLLSMKQKEGEYKEQILISQRLISQNRDKDERIIESLMNLEDKLGIRIDSHDRPEEVLDKIAEKILKKLKKQQDIEDMNEQHLEEIKSMRDAKKRNSDKKTSDKQLEGKKPQPFKKPDTRDDKEKKQACCIVI